MKEHNSSIFTIIFLFPPNYIRFSLFQFPFIKKKILNFYVYQRTTHHSHHPSIDFYLNPLNSFSLFISRKANLSWSKYRLENHSITSPRMDLAKILCRWRATMIVFLYSFKLKFFLFSNPSVSFSFICNSYLYQL